MDGIIVKDRAGINVVMQSITTMPPLPNPPILASDGKRTCPGTTANILVTILEALCRFYIRNVPQSVLHKKEPTCVRKPHPREGKYK
jgi:hypothetical protein